MFFQQTLIYISVALPLLTQLIVTSYAACLPEYGTHRCLYELDETEAKEKLKYVLSKYEEVQMKIPGDMKGVRGIRLTYANTEEINISFRYIDGAPHEIAQTCTFILVNRSGACEAISIVCNPLVSITPRPLLTLEPLDVCEDEEEYKLSLMENT